MGLALAATFACEDRCLSIVRPFPRGIFAAGAITADNSGTLPWAGELDHTLFDPAPITPLGDAVRFTEAAFFHRPSGRQSRRATPRRVETMWPSQRVLGVLEDGVWGGFAVPSRGRLAGGSRPAERPAADPHAAGHGHLGLRGRHPGGASGHGIRPVLMISDWILWPESFPQKVIYFFRTACSHGCNSRFWLGPNSPPPPHGPFSWHLSSDIASSAAKLLMNNKI